jgi:hypothetical protein
MYCESQSVIRGRQADASKAFLVFARAMVSTKLSLIPICQTGFLARSALSLRSAELLQTIISFPINRGQRVH